MAADTIVWHGNESLRGLLVPINSLTPHPKNPRTHNVEAIRKSLDEFGQQPPVLALASEFNGLPAGTIVAGHGRVKAAREMGWTHIGVIASDLDGDEIDRYLLADNRTGDLGGYDDERLIEILGELADKGKLDATGYTVDDYEDIIAGANRVAETSLEEFTGGYAEDDADMERRATALPVNQEHMRQIIVPVSEAEHRKVTNQIKTLAKEYGQQSVTGTVLEALDREFRRVWEQLPVEERTASTEDVPPDAPPD